MPAPTCDMDLSNDDILATLGIPASTVPMDISTSLASTMSSGGVGAAQAPGHVPGLLRVDSPPTPQQMSALRGSSAKGLGSPVESSPVGVSPSSFRKRLDAGMGSGRAESSCGSPTLDSPLMPGSPVPHGSPGHPHARRRESISKLPPLGLDMPAVKDMSPTFPDDPLRADPSNHKRTRRMSMGLLDPLENAKIPPPSLADAVNGDDIETESMRPEASLPIPIPNALSNKMTPDGSAGSPGLLVGSAPEHGGSALFKVHPTKIKARRASIEELSQSFQSSLKATNLLEREVGIECKAPATPRASSAVNSAVASFRLTDVALSRSRSELQSPRRQSEPYSARDRGQREPGMSTYQAALLGSSAAAAFPEGRRNLPAPPLDLEDAKRRLNELTVTDAQGDLDEEQALPPPLRRSSIGDPTGMGQGRRLSPLVMEPKRRTRGSDSDNEAGEERGIGSFFL